MTKQATIFVLKVGNPLNFWKCVYKSILDHLLIFFVVILLKFEIRLKVTTSTELAQLSPVYSIISHLLLKIFVLLPQNISIDILKPIWIANLKQSKQTLKSTKFILQKLTMPWENQLIRAVEITQTGEVSSKSENALASKIFFSI